MRYEFSFAKVISKQQKLSVNNKSCGNKRCIISFFLAQRPVVNMGSRQEAHIENLLHNIRANEACPPQPHRSGADPDQ